MGNIFENSSFFQVLLLVRRSTRIRGRKKRHENVKSALFVNNVHFWLKNSFFDYKCVFLTKNVYFLVFWGCK